MKITLRILLIALLGTAGFMIFNLAKMNTGTIIMCVDNDGGIRIPSQVCEYYLHNHRDIKKDVDELASGAGLSFILNGSSKEKKYKIAEFFIENGLDVNGVNHYGDYNLPPIFDAISFNDAEMARFLIKHGADLAIRPLSINMTPLEFAQSRQTIEPTVDRSEILEILTTSNL